MVGEAKLAFGPGDASRAPKSAPAVPTLTVRSLYQSSPSQGGHSRCLTIQSMMTCLIVMPSSLPLHMRRACVRSDIASDQYLPKCGPELQRQEMLKMKGAIHGTGMSLRLLVLQRASQNVRSIHSDIHVISQKYFLGHFRELVTHIT